MTSRSSAGSRSMACRTCHVSHTASKDGPGASSVALGRGVEARALVAPLPAPQVDGATAGDGAQPRRDVRVGGEGGGGPPGGHQRLLHRVRGEVATAEGAPGDGEHRTGVAVHDLR